VQIRLLRHVLRPLPRSAWSQGANLVHGSSSSHQGSLESWVMHGSSWVMTHAWLIGVAGCLFCRRWLAAGAEAEVVCRAVESGRVPLSTSLRSLRLLYIHGRLSRWSAGGAHRLSPPTLQTTAVVHLPRRTHPGGSDLRQVDGLPPSAAHTYADKVDGLPPSAAHTPTTLP
jgi:hypothetical protein